MNESQEPATSDLPTPEQLVGRQARLLRQGRRWSQQEVAQKMRAFGYQWSPATVTRLEAATRPIRLNELVDLAALYGVPVTQLLESEVPDDLDALNTEITDLTDKRDSLKKLASQTKAAAARAVEQDAETRARLARVEGRLVTLMRWHPSPGEDGGGK